MRALAASLATELPEFDTGWATKVVPLRDELAGELRPALLVLSGAVAFVLLIACANVANLLLARGAARQREIAIRSALGAARMRVVRQLLTESLVLGLAGGAAGLLVAQWTLALLVGISPIDLSSMGRIELSYPVLVFTAAISMLTAIVCGLAPAFEGARTDVQETLKDGARQIGAGVRHRRLRHAFVVAEIALAVVLLVGAGLMLRSFDSLSHAGTGFDATQRADDACAAARSRSTTMMRGASGSFASWRLRFRIYRASARPALSATCRSQASARPPRSRSKANLLRRRARITSLT